MTLQFSADIVTDGTLDGIETITGTSAILKIRTGSQPATCADADSGTVLATINLAADWAADAAGSSKALNSLPVTDASIDSTGTAGHFRLYASDGTTCHCQGTVGTVGTDLVLNTASFEAGGILSISAWTWTDDGALPEAPEGFAYLVNAGGDFIVNTDPAFILAEV